MPVFIPNPNDLVTGTKSLGFEEWPVGANAEP
jgi:hypothetical protein